jgi:dihydroorotate dehydrogenase (fumarate)
MDLTSSYAGITVRSPIVIGASPLALDIDRIKDLASHGAGMIVMPSIFEEQISKAQLDPMIPASSTPFEPDLDAYNGGTEGYLRNIESAKSAVDVPIVANINALTSGPWMRYAKSLESAGADAIEVNLYHYEVDPHRFAEDVEKDLVTRVSSLCGETKLPVAIKLLPQFTCLPNVAYRIAGAGAKSVCLFGQSPSFDLRGAGHVGYRWRLTTQADRRVSWEAIRQVRAAVRNLTLAASGGIQSYEDALVALELGADVVMITSAIYQQGGSLIEKIRQGLAAEMTKRQLRSLRELIGSQGSGFNPYPESARRRSFSSSIVEFSEVDIEPKGD